MTVIEHAKLRTARKGDIVRFKSYSIRVEREPKLLSGTGIELHGRLSTHTAPLATKRFLDGSKIVVIERATATPSEIRP